MPGPCPVCDHPTGDCAHGNHDGLRPLFSEWAEDAPAREEPTIPVDDDVYEDVAGPHELTPRWRLVARAGQRVTVATARRLGLMPDRDDRTSGSGPSPEDREQEPTREPGSPRDKARPPDAPRDRVERK